MQSIGLGEALALWFGGEKLDDLALYGLSTVWWARIAKIATYIAGLTVVLDLVGAERVIAAGQAVRQMSTRSRRRTSIAIVTCGVLGFFVVLGLLGSRISEEQRSGILAIGFFLTFSLASAARALVSVSLRGFGWALARRGTQLAIRITALVVLTLSFAFDLLLS